MSTSPENLPPPPAPSPLVPPPVPPQAPPPQRGALLGCAFAASFLVNILAGLLIVVLCIGLAFRGAFSTTTPGTLEESHHSGSRSAKDKVAVIRIDGVILEGALGYAHKQIKQAAKDSAVKAVVVRINSPGGSITASDDLFRRLMKLRDGDQDKDYSRKPLVASFAGLAASGGYYAAMPAATIFAEETTITGSIGVYASFPNVHDLAKDYGVSWHTLKAGAIKDAGSPFKKMSDSDRLVLQDMVDDAYDRFLTVVTQGRPQLTRAKLLERFQVTPLRPDPQIGPPARPYTRYRADGGIYSARKARTLGLIDQIGDLDKAIAAASQAAELDDYRAITYARPRSFTDLLFELHPPVNPPDTLRRACTPRLWYLAPGYEAEAFLVRTEREAP